MNSKMISTSELKLDSTLKDLYGKNRTLLDNIMDSMKAEGFREDRPIIVDEKDNTVVDGHTRLIAANNVGISEVPVIFRQFKDSKERLDAALHEQRDRRQLTDDMILQCVRILNKTDYEGLRTRKEKEHNYLRIAQAIGISIYKVHMAKQILKKCSEEQVQNICDRLAGSYESDNEQRPYTLRQAWKKEVPKGDKKRNRKADNAQLARLAAEYAKKAYDASVKIGKRVESGEFAKRVRLSATNPKYSPIFQVANFNFDQKDDISNSPMKSFDWFLVGSVKPEESEAKL